MQRPHRNICGGSCIDALHFQKRCNVERCTVILIVLLAQCQVLFSFAFLPFHMRGKGSFVVSFCSRLSRRIRQ